MNPPEQSFDGVLDIVPADLSVPDGNGGLLQSGFWGFFKSRWGWRPLVFEWKIGGDSGQFPGSFLSGTVLVLERRFPGGLKMAYVPYGPVLPESFFNDISGESQNGRISGQVTAFLAALARKIKPFLSSGCFMIRFDLKLDSMFLLSGHSSGGSGAGSEAPVDGRDIVLRKPFVKAPYRVQPQHTVVLDLSPETGEILARMHKKWRYNIRLAERRGVRVDCYSGPDAAGHLSEWYEIYKETSRRDGIALHSFEYYKSLFDAASDYPDKDSVPHISLYLASHEDDLLAGIIVARTAGKAVYLYGASGGKKRELMPNYLLQWRAVVDAKDAGASEYDLFGIPENDDPADPMHGLWRFKTGFGGRILHYPGAWDFPYIRVLYRFYAAAEKIRGLIAGLKKIRR